MTYPDADWKINVDQDSLYRLIKSNTAMVMDSVNGDLTIEGLLCRNEPVPGFSLSKTLYGVELTEADSVPPVCSAISPDGLVFVTYPRTIPGYTTVTITSRNKQSQSKFLIYNSVDSAFWNTGLKFITYNAGKDTIHVEPGIYEYNVVLPAGTVNAPALSPRIEVAGETYVITQPDALPGTARIKVIAIDTATHKDYLIHYTVMSGIDGKLTGPEVMILQNPVSDLLYIQSERPVRRIEIYTMAGIHISTEEKGGPNALTVDVSQLKPGLYIARIILEENAVVTRRIVVE